MKTQFDTRDFENANGFDPETSTGAGMWAFMAEGESEWMFTSDAMDFEEACEWAQEQRPEATDFTVGP